MRASQLFLEHAHAGLVLAQGSAAAAGLGIQLHQLPMRRFVRRVQLPRGQVSGKIDGASGKR